MTCNTHIFLSIPFIDIGFIVDYRIVFATLEFLLSFVNSLKRPTEDLTYSGQKDVWLPSFSIIA